MDEDDAPLTVEEAEETLDEYMPNWRSYAPNELDFMAALGRRNLEANIYTEVQRANFKFVNDCLNTVILNRKEQHG